MANQSQIAKDQKTSLFPMLSVRHGAKAVEFYKAAFGAGGIVPHRGPGWSGGRPAVGGGSGILGRGRVCTPSGENRAVWGPRSPEHKNFSPESLGAEFRGGATVRMVMVVADPDAVFARAVKAGATWCAGLRSANHDKEYGWRVGCIADPFGHHWEIARHWLRPAAQGRCGHEHAQRGASDGRALRRKHRVRVESRGHLRLRRCLYPPQSLLDFIGFKRI